MQINKNKKLEELKNKIDKIECSKDKSNIVSDFLKKNVQT